MDVLRIGMNDKLAPDFSNWSTFDVYDLHNGVCFSGPFHSIEMHTFKMDNIRSSLEHQE